MKIHDVAIAKIRQLPEPLAEQVKDFIDFMLMKQDKIERQMQQAYQNLCEAYIGSDDVKAIDVGYKYVDGKRTDDICCRIHLKKKKKKNYLKPEEVFPKEINGIRVDVIQATYGPTAASERQNEPRKMRQNIIQPGLSISHFQENWGTFGAVVYDNLSGRPCILSNWHVLVSGTDTSTEDVILQPGAGDGEEKPENRVGKLERYIIDERGDAAIAVLDQPLSRSLKREQFETEILIESARKAKIGDILEKSGRTTGVTKGKVDGIGSYKIDYQGQVGEKIIEGFKIVPVIDGNPHDEEISKSGDSGSIWYDPKTQEGVGLHFAGETSSNPEEHAIACHLPIVLEALSVSLVPPTDEKKASK